MINIYRNPSVFCNTDLIIKDIVNNGNYRVIVAPETVKAMVERLVINTKLETAGEAGISATGVYPNPENFRETITKEINVSTSMVGTEVLSFFRLSRAILDMTGKYKNGLGDEIILRNAIYKILLENHGQFKYLNKFVGKFEYIDNLISIIGDFRRYGVDDEILSQVLESSSEEDTFTRKLTDLKLLLQCLDEYNDQFGLRLVTDTIIESNKLMKKILSDKSLLDKRNYADFKRFLGMGFAIIGFGTVRNLTPQELEFVSLLNALGADIAFYPLGDNDAEGKHQLYLAGEDCVRTMTEKIPGIAVNNISAAQINSLNDENLETAISDYAFKVTGNKDTKTNAIVCKSILDIDDRIASVCDEIIRLTRDEGYRYRDIRIVCVDDSCMPRLQSVMKNYGMDGFIENNITMMNTPVFRYAESLLLASVRDYEYTELLKMMRTGVLPIRPEICDIFENYCVALNLFNGSRIFNKEFYERSDKNDRTFYDTVTGSQQHVGEYLWENVIENILVGIRATAEEIKHEKLMTHKAHLLGKHIEELSEILKPMIADMSKRGEDDKANAVVIGYRELMALLAAFTAPVNEVEISQDNFISLIRIDMRNKSTGSIPLKVDSVEIVKPEQAYITPCKVMFVIGANATNFPYKTCTEGVLDNSELRRLSENSVVNLPDKAAMQAREEFITSALMYGSVREKLYLVTEYGEPADSSYLHMLDYAASAEEVNRFKMPIYGEVIERNHKFDDAAISAEHMAEIGKDNLTVSVSSIEEYYSCPMRYAADYLLKIRPREDSMNVKTNVMGSIVHDMFQHSIERIVNELSDSSNNDKSVALCSVATDLENDSAKLEALSQWAFEKYTQNSKNPQDKTDEFYKYPGIKARRIFSKTLPSILKEISMAGFLPVNYEVGIAKREFDENGKMTLSSPLEITSDSNDIKFIFTGFVDRVDAKFDENDDVVEKRIVDYKSGSKKIELAKAYAGTQIQLFAYADAINKKDNASNVRDAGYCEIGLKPTEEGLSFYPKMANLSSEDFDIVVSFVGEKIVEACNSVAEGKMPALVNSKAGTYCDNCPYSGACGNNPKSPVKQCNSKLPEAQTLDNGKKENVNQRAVRAMRDDIDGNKKDGNE